jgi:hypothetical protein
MTKTKKGPNGGQAVAGTRKTYFMVSPDDLVIVGLDTSDGPEHYLWDERITHPLIPERVANIRALGVREAIKVEKVGEELLVVDGRRRAMHAREANRQLKAEGEPQLEVPIVVVKGDEEHMSILSISMNEHREGDTPLVRAAKAQRMYDRGVSIANIAIAFGQDQNTVRSYLKIAGLPAEVKREVASGKISASAAAKFANLPKEEAVAKVREVIEKAPAGRRPTVATARTQANPEAHKVLGRKALLRVVKQLDADDRFADGVRFALGLLDPTAYPEDIREILASAQ